MEYVSFVVLGKASPQGSKSHIGNGIMVESCKSLKPWRSAVAFEATQAMGELPMLDGPLNLEAVFVFPRPKAHYRTGKHAGELRDDAPETKPTAPDLSKLVRAVEDAMQGIVYRNDAQITSLDGTCKVYGEPACARIRVYKVR